MLNWCEKGNQERIPKVLWEGKEKYYKYYKEIWGALNNHQSREINVKSSDKGITVHWIGYAHNHAVGRYGIQSRYRTCYDSQDVVFLEPKETRKQEKEFGYNAREKFKTYKNVK